MKERLYAAGILASVLAIVAVVVFVFLFGRLDPSPPSLHDEPQPSFAGEILYVDGDGCVFIARASGEGEPRELICRRDIQGATWLSDGRVLYAATPGRTEWWVVDSASGAQSRVESNLDWWAAFGDVQYTSPKGETVSAPYNNDGDILVVGSNGRERKVFDYDGPDGYYPEFRAWSPDGTAFAVYYGREEQIWLITADGKVAGTLASGARWGTISWRIEGAGYLPALRTPVAGLD